MATLFYGNISCINSDGTANITLKDRESQVLQDIPFLPMFYETPKPGETVALLVEEVHGQIGKCVILGKMNVNQNETVIKAGKIIADEIEYKKATQKG